MTTVDLSRLTPEQRQSLARWGRFPWSLFVSADTYGKRLREFVADADRREAEAERAAQEAQAQALVDEQRSYLELIQKATTYTGPDYRIRFAGQRTWVRANPWQYGAALELGVERSIGVPEPTLVVSA